MSEYQYEPLSVSAGPDAIALANDARQSRLALCAGAGLSRSEPTCLPDGRGLSELIYEQAELAFPGLLTGVTRDDLLGVADTVSNQPNGLGAVQAIAGRVAPFTEALPNPGHRVTAALIVEGAVTALLTNWDDCIERAVFEGGRIQAVVTDHDRLHLMGALLLKVHGCATKVESLLLTRSQLSDPPKWASTEFAARVSTSSVVFIGLGDIASYAKIRVSELISAVHDVNHLHVVSPSIKSKWSGSEWEALTPSLPEDNKHEETADEFLDRLARAWVHLAFMDLRSAASASGNQAVVDAVAALIAALGTMAAVPYIAWLRASAVLWPSGNSVVHATATQTSLIALAVLSAGSIAAPQSDHPPQLVSGEPVHLIISEGRWTSEIRREAQRRAMNARNNGHLGPQDRALFLCSGHRGTLPTTEVVLDDITGPNSSGDIIDGPAAGAIHLLDANSVIGAA